MVRTRSSLALASPGISSMILRPVMCPGSPQPDSALVSPGEGEGCTSLTPSVKPGLDSLFYSTNMTDLCFVQTML